MSRCWRCGVDFDGTRYLARSPCPDCQLEDPTIEYRRLDVVREDEKERREDLIRDGWEHMLSDRQIGMEIGTSADTVLRIRTQMGLEPHLNNGGTTNWSDTTINEVTEASRRYWADPDRKQRKIVKGKRQGVLTAKGERHGWK